MISDNCNKQDKLGRTELHNAVIDRDITKVKELLQSGQDVNAQDKEGMTPLHFAAQLEATSIALLLIESEAVIDFQDNHGNTPLFKAVFNYRNDGSMIELLRKHGANHNISNNYEQTPLGLARLISNYNAAKYFNDLT